MKIGKAGIVSALLLVTSALYAAELPEGGQYGYLGGGVSEIGLGFTGISALGNIESVTLNPAALGDLRRVANSLTVGGFGTSNVLINAGFAAPTLTGVYSVNLLYLNAPSTATGFGNLVGADFAISKAITPNLFWGFGLKVGLANGAQPLTNDWNLGADLGVIYRSDVTNGGVGFNNYSWGVALKNLGKTIAFSTNAARYPAMGLGIGGSFYPFYFKPYKMKLSADLTVPWNPFDLAASVSMENVLFDMFKLRAAYTYTTYGVGPFSLGLGFTGVFLVDKTATDVDINYAMLMENDNGVQHISHWVNLAVAWGYYDDKPPAVETTPNVADFSPNFDGSQDTVTLSLGIGDNSMVRKWEVDIRDANGKTVKTFKSVDELQMVDLTFFKFFKQIFSKKKQVEIPPSVNWNGQDETGTVVPDGTYTYVLKAWDENGNLGETQAGSVKIDTVVPAVEVTNAPSIFSPNNDGTLDEYVLPIRTDRVQGGDVLTVNVLNSDGKIVRTIQYEGAMPDKVVWDGRNASGQMVPEGLYTIELAISDAAGNVTRQRVADVRLVTAIQTVSVTASAGAFSPNNDGTGDNVIFTPSVSDQTGLDHWELRLQNKQGAVVKRFVSADKVPSSIVWDGTGDNGSKLPDGKYTYQFQVFFDSGNHPQTDPAPVVIDTTPPQIQVTPEYTSFSPNADGNRDTLTFKNKIAGESNDTVEVYIKDSVGNVVFYGDYALSEFEPAFVWNGLDRDLKPLPEGTYTYSVIGTDKVGNRSEVDVQNIVLKTGLEKVSVQSDVPAISPNNSSANVLATFKPEVSSSANITGSVFEVLDSQNHVIRSLTTNKLLSAYNWDGRDNNGYLMPDGEYTYRLTVKYDYGDQPVSTSKKIFIDTKAPSLQLASDYTVFSPNNDGRQENLIVHPTVSGNPDDVYTFSVKDSSGNVVRSYTWTGTVPRDIVWDGRNSAGQPAPAGTYSVVMTAADSANNKTVQSIPNIRLVRDFETLKLQCASPMLAPTAGGSVGSVQFNYNLSSTNGLVRGALTVVKDSSGKVVRTIPVTRAGNGNIAWDGKDDSGNIVDDGTYTVTLTFEFDSGNVVSQSVPNIILDRTPPAYKLTVSPDVFTPDGDGDADTCYINLEVTDPNGVSNWSIKIFKKVPGWETNAPFTTINGSGNVKKLFAWDGTSDDGEDMVESVQDYVLVLNATDNLGNKLPAVTKDISVGVLVESTPEGLRIRISSIRFDSGRYNLTAENKQILDKVIYIIRKILSDPQKYGITPNYRIEVSGYTDDVGSDDYNLKLSQNRAKAVYDYLISQNVSASILTYKGYGESKPFKDITGVTGQKLELYRAMNRRVEFFIRR